MTIDEFVKYAHDHNYVIKTQEMENQALCIMNAYEKIRNDYDTRLKADLVAILKELQLEIEEMDPGCGWEGYRPTSQIIGAIQQKINALKAEIEPQESEG